MAAADGVIRGCAAEPSSSEMASLHQVLDAVHPQIVKWSSSEGGSGSKTGPEPAPEEEEEEEYVTRSTVRRGHKRELEFALRSQGEVLVSGSSSLSRTRSKTKSKSCVDEPSIPAEAMAMNVDPPTTSKVPTNPEELIASGWIDGASIKLVDDDDEENRLFAMIEDGRIFCSCDTCKSFTVIINDQATPSKFEQHANRGQRRKSYNHIYISKDVALYDLSISLSKEDNSTCYKACLGRLHLVKSDEVFQVTLKVYIVFCMLQSRLTSLLIWKSTRHYKTYFFFIKTASRNLIYQELLLFQTLVQKILQTMLSLFCRKGCFQFLVGILYLYLDGNPKSDLSISIFLLKITR